MRRAADVESQRWTNSQIGALLLVCGLLALMFGSCGTVISAIQLIVFQLLPAPSNAQERQFFYMLSRIQFVFLLFMPAMAIIAANLSASGWFVRRGSARAIRIARWTLIGALGWGVAYLAQIGAMLLDPRMVKGMLELPPPLHPYRYIWYAIQAVFTVGMLFGPPTLLLLFLRRARALDDKAISR
jgi:hypothetical protein